MQHYVLHFIFLDFHYLLKQKYCLCVYDIRTSLYQRNQTSLIRIRLLYIFVNSLDIIRKCMPLRDRFLYESLRIEVLDHKHRAETVVRIRITIRNVRIEHARIRSVIVITATFHERVRRVRFDPKFSYSPTPSLKGGKERGNSKC